MKFTQKILLLLSSLFVAFSAQAVDLSKVPDLRKVNLYPLLDEDFKNSKRPKHCTYSGSEQVSDPACYDFVLSVKEAFIGYAGKSVHLGKPLTEGNKARENAAGLDKIIENIVRVYSGTEQAILAKKPELNRSTAGLFNTFNNAIEDVKPYVLSIANGHYDRESLKRLDDFDKVFSKGWERSAPTLIQYGGISQDKARRSTNYYKKEISTIRHIVTQLNKYYQ